MAPAAVVATSFQGVRGFAAGMRALAVGARLVATDPVLRRRALLPALLLAGVCALVALLFPVGGDFVPGAMARRFFQTFAWLAPLPSLLLSSHYARLAAAAHERMGLGPAAPHGEPLSRALARVVAQAILIAVALVPATALLRLVPGLGAPLVRATAALWALHWIVVDALESARVTAMPPPPDAWFARLLARAAPHVPLLGPSLAWFARRLTTLARPFAPELALVEAHPARAAGFALATAALLATPVLNLVFRPLVVAGAVRLRGDTISLATSGDHTGSASN